MIFHIIKDWLDINYSQYYHHTYYSYSIIIRRYGSSLIKISIINNNRTIVVENCGTNIVKIIDDISDPDFFTLLKQCIDEQLRTLCVGHE